MTAVRTFFPQLRLAQLVARAGGMTREAALSAAHDGIESLRGVCEDAIEKAITDIETTVMGVRGKDLSEEQMHECLVHADQIYTLAGSFGFAHLQLVARSLCEMTAGLIENGKRKPGPIAVHAQTMRRFSPRATPLTSEEAHAILTELAKVLKFFNITPKKPGDAPAPASDTPVTA